MPNLAHDRRVRRGRPEPLPQRLIERAVDNNLLVVLILVLATFLLVVGRTLLGVDSWLTLMAGREITQHGLPHHEALTTIPFGRAWTDQQWLAQLVFYGLNRVGGLGLAVVFHSLMVTAAVAITVITSRVRGASSRMTLVAAVVCLLVAPWSWQLRAQSIALPLFALTLALMATDRRLRARRTFLVFPTLVVWANVHGSVVLGATLVSLAAVLGLPDLLRRSGAAIPPWRLALFLVAPWACVLVSPYGTDLVGYYRTLLISSPVSKLITEWQAPGAARLLPRLLRGRRRNGGDRDLAAPAPVAVRHRGPGPDARGRLPERARGGLVLAGDGHAAPARPRRHRRVRARSHPSTGASRSVSLVPWPASSLRPRRSCSRDATAGTSTAGRRVPRTRRLAPRSASNVRAAVWPERQVRGLAALEGAVASRPDRLGRPLRAADRGRDPLDRELQRSYKPGWRAPLRGLSRARPRPTREPRADARASQRARDKGSLRRQGDRRVVA